MYFAQLTPEAGNGPLVIIIGVGLILGLGLLGVVFLMLRKRLHHAEATVSSLGDLRDEKAKSGIIINAIDDGVILIDEQGVIQLFNPGAELITGWKAVDAIGIDFRSVFLMVDEKGVAIPENQHPLRRVFAERAVIRDSGTNLVTKSKNRISLSLSVSPLLAEDNSKVNGAVGIFRDVSKEREEEKKRAEFISTASHEMRTPVAAIEGYLALAMNDKVSKIDAKARDYLQKAHSSTQHLGKLFQDLLTSAKAEDGRLVNHPVVVEMGTYLDALAESLRFSAEKKGLLMDYTVGTSSQSGQTTAGSKVIRPLYYVHVDPDRLREVITNLFDNAVKYTPSGKISIGLTGNNEVVQLFIRDTGPGIPAEDVPHLFQKFYRVDNTATRTIGGTGLGLFICRKIVEMYRGHIWAESEVGQGSTFYINLPRLSTNQAVQLQTAEAQNTTAAPVTSLTTPVL